MKFSFLLAIILNCSVFADTPTIFVGDRYDHQIAAIATDASGNTYVTGSRITNSLSTWLVPAESSEVFVAKLDASNERVWIQYFPGKEDSGTALVTDRDGNVYVAGYTKSPNFPLRNPLQSEPATGFLMKLSSDGSRVIWSTYYGIRGTRISSIVLAPDGTLVLGGGVEPGGLPLSTHAFVAKVDLAANRALWEQRFNGGRLVCTAGSGCFTAPRLSNATVAVDPSGNIYAGGNTNTIDFPTTPGAFLERGYGPFVRKFSSSGTLLWSTLLTDNRWGEDVGSRPADTLNAIAVGPDGSVYVAGGGSAKWPTTSGAYKTMYEGEEWSSPSYPGPRSPYVARLNPAGTALTYSTFIGHAGSPATSIVLDSSGNAYVSGGPIGNTPSDYITAVNQSGSSLVFDSTYARGARGAGIVLDSGLRIHAAGPGGVVTIVERTAPASGISGVASAAGVSVTGRVVPGELISIYGWGLGDQVLVDEIPAHLLYVSATQINAVVPFGVADRERVTVSVRRGGVVTARAVVAVTVAKPEIFKTSSGPAPGQYAAAALNEDGTINSKENPAKVGSVIAVWGTGMPGWPSNTLDGSVNALSPLLDLPFFGLVQGLPTSTEYSGAAPGMVAGVFQMNVRIPEHAGPGGVELLAITGQEVGAPAEANGPVYVFVKR